MLTKLTRTSHLRPPWRPPAAHVGGPRHHQWSISRCVSLLRRRIHHPVARRADRECICTPKHSWPLMPFFSTKRTSWPPPPGQICTESCPYDGSDAHRRCRLCRRAGGTHQSRKKYLNGGRIIKFPSICPRLRPTGPHLWVQTIGSTWITAGKRKEVSNTGPQGKGMWTMPYRRVQCDLSMWGGMMFENMFRQPA